MLLLLCLGINVWYTLKISIIDCHHVSMIYVRANSVFQTISTDLQLCTNTSDLSKGEMLFTTQRSSSLWKISKQREKYQHHRFFKLVQEKNRLQNQTQHIEKPCIQLLNLIFGAYRSDLWQNWYYSYQRFIGILKATKSDVEVPIRSTLLLKIVNCNWTYNRIFCHHKISSH